MNLRPLLFFPLVAGLMLAQRPSVEKIDEAGLKRLIVERDGKVLFLNIWATWCTPCAEEFPDIVELDEEYGGRGVEFVGLSVDYTDEVQTKILPFIARAKARFKIYVADFTNDETLISFIRETWSGGIPATAIYDSGGKQQVFLVGQQSYVGLRNKIEVVLHPAQ